MVIKLIKQGGVCVAGGVPETVGLEGFVSMDCHGMRNFLGWGRVLTSRGVRSGSIGA